MKLDESVQKEADDFISICRDLVECANEIRNRFMTILSLLIALLSLIVAYLTMNGGCQCIDNIGNFI